ncbi:MAG: hypothetical protein WD847_15500 [Pirellulales bacterium]
MTEPEPEPESDDEIRAGWKSLGLPEPRFWDDSMGPEVDERVLLRLVRDELTDAEVKAVGGLIDSFASWNRAYTEVLAAEFRRRHPTDSAPES